MSRKDSRDVELIGENQKINISVDAEFLEIERQLMGGSIIFSIQI
jgi:hypothetical protein